MATIDCFMYNGEREILDIHLNMLDKYVDRFIIVEAKTTFTGQPKKLYFTDHEKYFSRFWKKITYHIIDENYTPEEIALAESSPNTRGAAHWKHEFLQKERIKDALKGLHDMDTVYIGDVDEIWEPIPIITPKKLKLRVFAYYLNNRSSEEFWGTLAAKYKDIKGTCLNHLRSDTSIRTNEYYGWHFTSMGGVDEVRRKLNDSYTTESYNTSVVQELLSSRVMQGADYLGRPFTFTVTEKSWPKYLKDNKHRYSRLLMPERDKNY